MWGGRIRAPDIAPHHNTSTQHSPTDRTHNSPARSRSHFMVCTSDKHVAVLALMLAPCTHAGCMIPPDSTGHVNIPQGTTVISGTAFFGFCPHVHHLSGKPSED